MSLESCYSALEGDYQTVLNRLRNEKIVKKFALKFLDDTSYELLEKSLETEDYKEAFRAAHTIKGITQNLSFTRLFTSINLLAEALRAEEIDKVPVLFPDVKNDYKITVDALRVLQAEE